MQQRPIVYDLEQIRSFDTLSGWIDTLVGDANGLQFVLGSNGTFTQGLIVTPASPASLVLNVANGFIAQNVVVDQSSYGSLPADTQTVLQLGQSLVGSVTLSTGALAPGQSQYVLIEAGFIQQDIIPSNDPNGGVLPYVNISDPSNPFYGPGNSGLAQDTVRLAVCDIQVQYGTPATTGSEVIPSVSAGYVPVAYIILTYGQTTVTGGEILNPNTVMGSPEAPVLAGLLNSHHGGVQGQAPGIILTNGDEVQGELPIANMVASNSVGAVSSFRLHSGNPNGLVAGNANVNGASDQVYDFTNNITYICTTTGNASSAVWTATNASSSVQFNPVIFTNSGNYTPSAGTKYVFVTVIGGGASGGADIAGHSGGGGGGGGGAQAVIPVTALTTPVPVTIGAGGVGVTGGASGNTGGTTSFGTYLAGLGGLGGANGNGTGSGAGGGFTSGVATSVGAYGSAGEFQSGNTDDGPGTGGTSAFGYGGGAPRGTNAASWGAGGGGVPGGTSGAGYQGIVVITEYIGA